MDNRGKQILIPNPCGMGRVWIDRYRDIIEAGLYRIDDIGMWVDIYASYHAFTAQWARR